MVSKWMSHLFTLLSYSKFVAISCLFDVFFFLVLNAADEEDDVDHLLFLV